ncbi:hypothetical protein [Saccharomonospora saliphila]|uniref:hypothetical protein n=1 Tax=Saccharomonospora saliphila TaxID=369829 RepID=UPI00036DFBB9|nr:hypothetical protein [Saccharomonospora saliphila]
MLVTVSFVVVTAALLAAVGRAVVLPIPDPDVDPPFARTIAKGALVVWLAGQAHADRVEAYIDALSGRRAQPALPSR